MTVVPLRARGRLCGGGTKSGGKCRRPAGWGTDHVGAGRCKLHFGNTRTAVVASANELVTLRARDALAKLGEPVPLLRPVARLQLLAGEVDQWLEACRLAVQELEGDLTVKDDFGKETERALVKIYTEAMDRMHRIGADLVRLNLEERAQRLNEVEVRRVLDAIVRGLEKSLSGAQLEQVKADVAQELEGMSD